MQPNGAIKAMSMKRWWLSMVWLLALIVAPAKCVFADAAIEREFEFARGLIRMDMPSLAENVMERLVMRRPETEARADVIRAEAMIHRRRLSAAEEILRNLPEDSPSAQAILLALADAYFNIGERTKTREIYSEFFAQYDGEPPTDPDVIRNLRLSAHKYVQMLIYDRDYKNAVDVYDLLLSVTEERAQQRQVLLEQAEIALQAVEDAGLEASEREALFNKAEHNFTEVLWGGMDLWFGRALTAYAQLKAARGDRREARRMLQSNIRLMRDMDEQLEKLDIPVAESPMAGARSLLGWLYLEEGQAVMAPEADRHLAALNHFERALQAFSTEWPLMMRAKLREDAARERAAAAGEAVPLTAARATTERMRPYNDMLTALEGFIDTLRDISWAEESVERARELDDKVRELFSKVREFEFEPGVPPDSGLELGDDFSGLVELRQAALLLRPENERRSDAVNYYVRALTEYYNVFANYAGSHWSTTAGEIVSQLRNTLYDLTGRNVVIELGAGQEERLAQVYIREGHGLFGREQYSQAIEQYLLGLNTAGESADALIALSNMMEAHARRNETYTVRALAHYVAERFSERSDSAQALLRIGRHYFDAGNMEMYLYLYELFLRSFPDHGRAPAVLFMLGEQQWRVESYQDAAVYYRRIVEKYPRSTQYLDALNRIGWGYFLAKDYTNAITAFNDYIEEIPPSRDRAQAKLSLAESYRQAGQPLAALEAYEELVSWLKPDPNPYSATTEERQRNRELLKQAEFFIGFALAHLNEPEDQTPEYRERAIRQFRKFIDDYPDSELAPTAMASLGAVYFERDRADEAAETFEQLSARYPDSEAGQNARFAMIRSLIDIQQMSKAKEVFQEMLADADRYSPGQFVRVGQLMLDRGEYADAESAFLQVVDATEERSHLERSFFGLGRAQVELGKYAEAVDNLQELNRRYPRSGRFFDARFLLGRALAEQEKYAEAVEALHDVFRRARDAELVNRASLELAHIQLRRGAVDDALASFQRIVLLADPAVPEVRPIFEQAVVHSIRLFMNKEDWNEVIEHSDLYMSHFTLGADASEVRNMRSEAIRRRAEG